MGMDIGHYLKILYVVEWGSRKFALTTACWATAILVYTSGSRASSGGCLKF